MEVLQLKKKLMKNQFIINSYRKFKNLLGHISPILNSKLNYYTTFGRKLNLQNPKEFNEKLMYLNLNNYLKNPTIWRCSDKYEVRNYALSKGISEENLTKLYGTYKNPKEIDYEKLPNKFVLKCSHGCGFNYIVEDKSKLDIKNANKTLKKWKNKKFGYEGTELQYTHIKPTIMCEEFIESQKGELPFDYKLYCFNGVAKVVLVCSDRKNSTCLNYFDLNWNELPIPKEELKADRKIEKPKTLDKMIEIAEVLSKDIPFVRIDFYEYHNKALLGEMTFTPAANCAQYYSDYGNKILSEMLGEVI